MERPCRLCGQHDFSEDAMRAQIDEYIQSLPEDMLVMQSLYEVRLRACYGCGQQRGGVCALCGCYVRVRAAKRALACPDANGKKW